MFHQAFWRDGICLAKQYKMAAAATIICFISIFINKIYISFDSNDLIFDVSVIALLGVLFYEVNLYKTISKQISKKIQIPENSINLLIDQYSESSSTSSMKIIDLLLCIDETQHLDKDLRKKLLESADKKNEIINDSIVRIAINGICNDVHIPDALTLKILNQIETSDNDVQSIYCLYFASLLNKTYPKLFEKVLVIFENSICHEQDDAGAKVLLKQIALHPNYLNNKNVTDVLRNIALCNDVQQDISKNSTALQCLKPIAGQLSKQFYINYYKNLEKLLNQSQSSDSEKLALVCLEQFLKDASSEDTFNMLEILSVILTNNNPIDLTIFNQFSTNEWRKELLSYLLLGKLIGLETSGNSINNFIIHINSLKEFLIKSNVTIESILEILITIQNDLNLNIQQLNNILVMLKTNQESIQILCSSGDNFPNILQQIEIVWLKHKLFANQIKFDDEQQFLDLKLQLTYFDMEVLDHIFMNFQNETGLPELINFFKVLNDSSNLDRSAKNSFLTNKTLIGKSVTDWTYKLFNQMTLSILNDNFPNYKQSENILPNANITEFSKSSGKYEKLTTNYASSDTSKKRILNENLGLGKPLNNLLNSLQISMTKLALRNLFTEAEVQSLIESLDSEIKIEKLQKCLDIIIEYGLENNSDHEIFNIISTSSMNNVDINIYKLAIDSIFPGTYEKQSHELFNELVELNRNENISILMNGQLLVAHQNVMSSYNSKSKLFPDSKIISEWTESDIRAWSKLINSNGSKDQAADVKSKLFDYWFGQNKRNKIESESLDGIPKDEKLAVILRAFELTNDFSPRLIQLFSVLFMLHSNTNRGRLAQINTGEGKTGIIAMIAAIFALDDHKVDIVTSSPLLAIPQSKQNAKFFSLLDISVAHNCNNNHEGYLADIVYGTAFDFQADILRDEYSKLGTRHGRLCDIAIVDEVDSMLIDGKNHIVMLSSPMPGMNHLETILAAIIVQINATANCIQEVAGQAYYLPLDELHQNESEVNGIPIQGTKEEFIIKSTEKHIRNLIRDNDCVDKDYAELKIPKHLRELVCSVQISEWIQNAIRANFYFKNGRHYILRDGKVAPVDAHNTGIVQENQHWNDGLHQFLEIKHGAKIQPESLTSNYLSNVGYFRRYGDKIYGLTGTLGDSGTTKLLKTVYGVDSVIIPPFKKKQHKELPSILINTSQLDWYEQIVISCIKKLYRGRAVLIITKYIDETEAIAKIFTERFGYDSDKIKLFKTDTDVSIIDKKLQPGDVIITTNIAGRGTDIKLSDQIDQNGGLHVCLTFLPINSRVELQNIGRTARTGNRGTSQFVLYDKYETNINKLKYMRDMEQDLSITNAEKEIEVVNIKDMIFMKFCDLLNQIKGRNIETRKFEIEAVEERFAIWLKLQSKKFHSVSNDLVFDEFSKFEEKVLEDDANSQLIENPYFYVLIGNQYLYEKNYLKAIEEFTKAIELDENFAENAYFNRGYALTAQYGEDIEKYNNFIENAIEDFGNARKLIQLRVSELHLLKKVSDSGVFSEQIADKINLYKCQLDSIHLAIGPDSNTINDLTNIENHETLVKDSAGGVIQQARISKRNLKIKLLENKISITGYKKSPHDDHQVITEYKRNGFIGAFKIYEKKPIDWKAAVSLVTLGLSQLFSGAALSVFTIGAGSSFAFGLMMEGVSDIVSSVRDVIINRDFSWAFWAIQKAVVLTVSIVCSGFKAMKDVFKTATAGLETVGNKVFTQTVKTGWQIVAKKSGTELAKGVARQIVLSAVDCGIERSIMPKIHQKITRMIEGPIHDALAKIPIVQKMLELDEINKNHYYQEFLSSLVIVNPQTDQFHKIAQQISRGIAGQKIEGFSAAVKITVALMALDELTVCVPNFIEKLNTSIIEKCEIDKISLDLDHVENDCLHHLDKQEQLTALIDGSNLVSDAEKEDINLKRSAEEQITLQKKYRSPVQISKDLIANVAANMMFILRSKIVAPSVMVGVDYHLDNITQTIDKSVENEVENFRATKRIIKYQNELYNNHDGVQTVDKKALNKVEKLIEDARSGGPSGLPYLGAVSQAIGSPIEVYDELGNMKYIIGDAHSGQPIQVQYHKPDTSKTIGHFTMANGSDAQINGVGNNMCLYNVIAEQIGVNPNILKDRTLDIMETNKLSIAKQSEDIMRLEMYEKLTLNLGGAKYNGRSATDAKGYLDRSENIAGFAKNARGHARGHASAPNPPSVEQYSIFTQEDKSGFDSQSIQNTVAHITLSHNRVQQAMTMLNYYDSRVNFTEPYIRQVVKLSAAELQPPQGATGGTWRNGNKIRNFNIGGSAIILQHFRGQQNNANYDVHIQTFYPN